ncbi:Retrovirus-related Pol polyprotein from type-2 retrotransposable element R2DM [Sesamum angolense]|uniref:Retrovirus-related Pol polyprotein from type-2 retrotransposable element R2DM n=1 Tax=Sesamum angolense TaxID=2727404 RepID=A0AAE1T7T3_9LAMI|nr:Retrovirus-related Pol polyprotein from type-2 retrotransposable element R2DM [Sesamum angolense]
MMGPRPSFAMDVVGMGGFSSPPAMAMHPTSPDARNPPRSWVAPPWTSTDTAAAISSLTQPLISPLLGPPAVEISPATLLEIFVSTPRIWAAPPQQPAAPAALPLQPPVSWPPAPLMPSIGSTPVTSPPKIFIGNVPLKPCSDPFVSDDKIAAAFHNSTRKTLTYIPPSVQNGEVLVRPSIDMIREGSNRWNTTAVGYFLGKRPYFHHLNDFVRPIWPAVRDVKATSNGFFFFQFKIVAAMEEVLEGGPWLYLGQPIVLQKWEPGMVLRKLKHTEVPVWIKLRHLPVELWTTDGLSTVASGIGRPLYPDAITRACTRLDFARVCVMLNVSLKLPKHIVIMMPNEHGGESACKVDVEYEWLPPKCTNCTSLGHATKECPLTKPVKPAVSIYLRKNQTPAPAPRTGDPIPNPNPVSEHPGAIDDMVSNERPHQRTDKGRIIRSPCETLSPNSGYTLSLYWKLGLCHQMYVGCKRVYYLDGGGDFNAVLDMSEVSGASGDIRVAMHEFNDCVIQTGLISLPMQGERFSWHNCSTDGRSLWKRLDHMLVNDAWLEQWPNIFYTCLTPRTSDHSPLVLKGDSRDVQVSMFRFDNYLALSPGFLASVHNIWQHPVIGTPMYSVTRKLKALKPMFHQQRRKKGDLAMNVKLATGFLEVAQILLQADRHNSLLLQLENCCRLVYLKATQLEHVMLRQRAKLQWLKGGDQCSKDLLGGDRTDRALDLQYLRPWARHILTEEEACALIRPVTVDDVKTTMFDIEEDKAPGPDGFSPGFYKAAWPIVGKEISKAIMDLLTTGRILKQVNVTLLTLIPKVRTPHSVTDFRPISCCNVIYKVISKILVCRFREILNLLISPSQNAFVPVRLISDSVLLAQELFFGYNQCRLPPRCALKVDLRKAYDTVEWDFLFATLRLFGFPAVFIRWIEECVTSAHYSVVVNGGVHGFFAGARGLRQGDPMSPYLYVLVMEVLQMILQQFIDQDGQFLYHWRCTELKLFQLSFADDLLLLCKADVRSLLDYGIHCLRRWGSRKATYLLRTLVYHLFQQGSQSQIVNRCYKKSTAALRDGRESSSPLQGIINEMIKRLRTFLWKGTSSSGYPKVTWEVVCRPIEEGGQGIKDIFALNRALMSKHLWAVIKQDRTSIWVDWISQVRLRIVQYGQLRKTKKLGVGGKCSHLDIHCCLISIFGGWYFLLLWHDPWHPLGPLIIRFPRGPQMSNTGPLDKLSVVMEDRQWNWPMITDIACLEITHMLPPISEGQDGISWKSNNGSFNTSTAYNRFRPPGPKTVTAFCVRMESQRHMTTFSLHAPFPADVLPLSDSRYHFFGPTVIGNEEFTERHPDGEESMWLIQHFDLYWPH